MIARLQERHQGGHDGSLAGAAGNGQIAAFKGTERVLDGKGGRCAVAAVDHFARIVSLCGSERLERGEQNRGRVVNRWIDDTVVALGVTARRHDACFVLHARFPWVELVARDARV
jgi:hypothetical protein